MKKKLFILLIVAITLILSLFIFRKELHEETYTKKELSDYQNTYIGDNSSVNNILLLLPYAEFKGKINLQTTEQPYGLTVEYNMDGDKDKMKYNSEKLFELIQNVGTITYKFNNQEVTVNREGVIK